MANGKHPTLMYFLSPDLQIKIAQKSAKPPNMQHHTLPTFSDTTARRKNSKEKKETKVSLLKTVSLFPSGSRVSFAIWFSVNVQAQARVLDTCVCRSFLYVCVPGIECVGSSHEIYYIHTVCIFKKKKKKTSNGKNLLHCEIS